MENKYDKIKSLEKLTAEQMGYYCGVHSNTVKYWIKTNKIVAKKVGYFRKKWVITATEVIRVIREREDE